MSPLHIIVRNANVMAVKALLQVAKASNQMAGEKVLQQLTNLRTSHSNTALHYAAGNNPMHFLCARCCKNDGYWFKIM